MKLKVSKFRMKIYHRSTEIVTYIRQSHRQIKARRWNAGAATNPMENPLNKSKLNVKVSRWHKLPGQDLFQ